MAKKKPKSDPPSPPPPTVSIGPIGNTGGPDRSSGRDAGGRFTKGNPGGPGNPNITAMGKYRVRLTTAIRPSDVDLAVRTLRTIMRDKNAKACDRIAAARELLNRTIGVPVQSSLLERLEDLEKSTAQKEEDALWVVESKPA